MGRREREENGSEGQERVLDPLELVDLQVIVNQCEYWVPNMTPLEEEHVLLTTELCLELHYFT